MHLLCNPFPRFESPAALKLTKPIHVLGIGSPFGSDTLGWDVIDELAKHETGFVLHKLLNPMLELLPAINGAGSVIVVDMVVGGGEDEFFFDHYSKWQPKGKLFSSHGLGVMEALKVAENLGELPGRCFVFGVSDRTELNNIFCRISAFLSV